MSSASQRVELTLPWGEGELPLRVPAERLIGVVSPAAPPEDAGEHAVVETAMAEPIGAPRLRDLARGARTAAVVISDVTRPCPSYKFLPALMAELDGIPKENVTVIAALGSHRRHTAQELHALVGDEIMRRYRVIDLDDTDCVPVAVTSRGTPLEVFRPFLEADLRICSGNIEYHYFAGFSGGAKAMMPGICSRAAIQPNHSNMLHPLAKAGVLDGNPVREDIEEAGELVRIDFIFNVVLDEKKRIVRAVAGHYRQAFREGVRLYEELFDLTTPQAADVIVASPGGWPKDLNLYQAQKTLDNVAPALRHGGTVILAARCEEGFGSAVFEEWMQDISQPKALIERIQRTFVLGGHKAAAIADLLQRARIWLVSALPEEVVERMGFTPFADLDTALAAALDDYPDGRVLVVPFGNRIRALIGR